MRRQSVKTAAINAAIAPTREEYARTHRCVISLLYMETMGRSRQQACQCSDVHEIIGGNHARHKTKLDPRFWLPVQRIFHKQLQETSKPRQWALKFYFFPDEFDWRAMIEIRGSVVSVNEFIDALAELRKQIIAGPDYIRIGGQHVKRA